MVPLVIIVILLILSALFSSSELAIMGIPIYKIKQVVKSSKSKLGKILLELREKKDRTLITILLGNNLVNVILSIYASQLGDSLIKGIGITGAIGLFVISLSITFMILMFGEIIPKVFATQFYLQFALKTAPIIKFLTIILWPIVIILELFTNFFKNLLKPNEDKVTRDDVEIFVEDGKKQGIFSSIESMIIRNLLDFNQRSVEYIVKHRTEVFALSDETILKDAIQKILDKTYSRIPVFSGDKDKIIGLLTIRDILNFSLNHNNLEFKLSKFELRKVFKVPLTASIMDVFLKMKKLGQHFAVVVDERGGTEGIVTFEDILEDMVGEIRDEYDLQEENEIEIISDNELEVKGEVLLRDILMTLKIDNFEIPEELEDSVGDEDMISYIILIKLRHFAKVGEIINFGKLIFTISQTNRAEDKILRVNVKYNNKNLNNNEILL